jgi:hypothetical protein
MAAHTKSNDRASFKYDPFGRRLYKSSSSGTSIFAYDTDNLVEVTNSSGVVGGMAIGLLAKYPEVIGKPQGQTQDMFGKLRDANNRKIDSLLGQAALQPACGCSK